MSFVAFAVKALEALICEGEGKGEVDVFVPSAGIAKVETTLLSM